MNPSPWSSVCACVLRPLFGTELIIQYAAVLLTFSSVPGLNQVVDSARESIAIGNDLLDIARVFTERSVDLVMDTAIAFAEFIKDFNGICPKLQTKLCENLDRWETCRLDEIFGENFIFGAIVRHFSSDKTVVLDQVEQARDLIADMQTFLKDSDDFLNNVDWLFHLSSFFSILLACLCAGVILSLFLELPTRVRQWSYRFFLAVFVFLVSFSFIFSIAFVVTSTTMADACFGSPDDRLKEVLEEQLDSMRPFSAVIARYVIDSK
jgi:hypothetical protein